MDDIHPDDQDVAEILDRLEAGESLDTALRAVVPADSGRAELLRRRVEVLKALGVLRAPDEAQEFPERLGEYRLRSRLGGGGMGVVYLAEQPSLGREVAIKVIHPAQLLFTGARERFRREVDAIARLQHPGIVPVHAVGEHEGAPYLVMEVVRGATLAQVLAELQSRDPGTLRGSDMEAALARLLPGAAPGGASSFVFAGSWEEACLRVVRQVAEALHHAHGRGVVHRDVKPSNVMLGADGRAQLLDFGLALATGSDSLTRSGSPLGSLPYMSPEQTRGEAHRVDPRTDVYGLGVLLHELLTLRSAFGGSSAAETVAAIQAGRRVPPRQLNAALSWEVETVCLTAMDPDPGRRYASAADLARDLANVLEHRPVEARRAGPALRTRRWVQRHPTRAVSVGLGGLLVVVGPSVLAWQQHLAAQKLRAEQAATDEQRRRAEEHLRGALAAVDTMLTQVGDVALRNVAGMQELRRRLLDEALALHRGMLAQERGRAEVVLATANVLLGAGEAHLDMGLHERAEELYREAIEALERLVTERPDHQEARGELARALRYLAVLFGEQGRVVDATPLNLRAIELGRSNGLTEEDSRMQRAQLGISLNNHAGTVWQHDLPQAETALRAAVDLFEALAAEDPAQPGYRYHLAESLANLGTALAEAAQPGAAGDCTERAIALVEALVVERPDVIAFRARLAALLCNSAVALSSRDVEQALGRLRRAEEIQAALAEASPQAVEHPRALASTRINLGSVHARTEDWPAAAAAWGRAEAALAACALSAPDDWALSYELALARGNLAWAHERLGEPATARPLAERAVEALERLVAADPADASWQGELSDALHTLARLLVAAGEPDAARARVVQAITHAEAALAIQPLDADLQRGLSGQRSLLQQLEGASSLP